MAIFHNFWKFWNLIMRLKNILRLKIFLVCFWKVYYLSFQTHFDSCLLDKYGKKSTLLGPSAILPNFEPFLGYFYAILCDFSNFGPKFHKNSAWKIFFYLFFAKYKVSAFKRTSIQVFWTVRTREVSFWNLV